MSNRILVNPGTEQAWEISLQPGANRIGRSADNDFTIDHASVSTQHCEVVVSDAGVFLKDLGSTNGTFINRSPVREAWLQPGQHIQFGAIDTIFESDQPASAPPQPGQPAPGATVVVAAIGSPTASQPSASAGLRLNRPELPAEETPAEISTPTTARTTGRPGRFPVHAVAEREAASKKRFLLGAVGAVVGGLLGATVWYFLIKSTGSAFALVAWGVGAVTGLGAILLAKRGSMALGVLSATCALLAIVFGEYLAVKSIVTKEGMKLAVFAYVGELDFARKAVKAESPEDLRKLLAEENEKNPAEITDAELTTFQDEEMPRLRDLAKGKPSRTEYAKELGTRFAEEFDYQEYFFHEDVKSGLFMVLFAVLGIASAYKIASGDEAGD